MNDERIAQHVADADAFLQECLVYAFPTRDPELQRAALTQLRSFLEHNSETKREAIRAGYENFANLCLGIEYLGSALYSEISMWLLLKEGNPDAAWDDLVAAQTALCNAMKSHSNFHNLEEQVERLDNIEWLVFPPQMFFSMGVIARSKICSICQRAYEECEHIAGHPYWGELCGTIVEDIEANHVAIVSSPANKLCRIVSFQEDGGGRRNKMTWKLEPTTDELDGH
jgi:hypothetical protein